MGDENRANSLERTHPSFEKSAPKKARDDRREGEAGEERSARKKQRSNEVADSVNRRRRSRAEKIAGKHDRHERKAEFQIPKLNRKESRQNNLQRCQHGKAGERFEGFCISFFQEKNLLFPLAVRRNKGSKGRFQKRLIPILKTAGCDRLTAGLGFLPDHFVLETTPRSQNTETQSDLLC